MSDEARHLRHAVIDWTGGLTFSADSPVGKVVFDGDSEVGLSPMVTLLLAAGSCAGIDVVMILKKMKVDLASLRIELTGRRNEEPPRRYNKLTLRFLLSGTGLTETNVARAVELSVQKYCSVLQSLDPATPIETEICRPFIERQIELVNPDILVCLGKPSMQTLLGIKEGIRSVRGRWFDFDTGTRTINALVTFHPAYLLRSPLEKRHSWRDFLALKKALAESDRSPS